MNIRKEALLYADHFITMFPKNIMFPIFQSPKDQEILSRPVKGHRHRHRTGQYASI